MSVGVLHLSDKMIIIMIISFVFAWKKEQKQSGGPRFYWNIIYDKFAGLKGQRHQFYKHTLCLAPLFVREGVVNRACDVVCVWTGASIRRRFACYVLTFALAL